MVARKIVIKNEQQALEILESALNNAFGDETIELDFKKWPTLTIKLEGKGYESTITPDIAEALVQLQHALNRAYARVAHSTTNARSLTMEEKRDIKFKAKVEKGSSLINVELGDYAEKLTTALAGKMTGQDIVIAVLGTAFIGAGYLSYKAWLKHRAEEKVLSLQTQERVRLSQEETRRLEIVTRALQSKPELAHTVEDFDDVRREIVKSVGDADRLEVQGIEITGDDARKVASTPRTKSEDVQLNGHYIIQKIDWQQPDEVRMSLASTDKGLNINATYRTALAMDEDQKNKLQKAEWERKALHMQINATRLRGEITSASIVTVEWPKRSKA